MLKKNGLIHDSQHGFCRGRSCETNLLVLMEYHCQMAEEVHNKDDCYFDLKAFFDGIPHQRCLASLNVGQSEHGQQPGADARGPQLQMNKSTPSSSVCIIGLDAHCTVG